MKQENVKLYETWDKFWSRKHGITLIGKILMDMSINVVKTILSQKGGLVGKNARIIDIGCGSGRTMGIIRSWGYSNIIGIDNSEESIKLCQDYGFIKDKDVFVMDGTKTTYDNAEFELLFSEGILEHFIDFSPFVKEMTRISSKYILLIQPNHFSFFGRVINFLSEHVRHNVKEYSYRLSDFISAFETNGFYLKEKKDTLLKDFWVLLFEKGTGGRNR